MRISNFQSPPGSVTKHNNKTLWSGQETLGQVKIISYKMKVEAIGSNYCQVLIFYTNIHLQNISSKHIIICPHFCNTVFSLNLTTYSWLKARTNRHKNTEITPCKLLDHHRLNLDLNNRNNRELRNSWKLNTSLLNEKKYVKTGRKKLKIY